MITFSLVILYLFILYSPIFNGLPGMNFVDELLTIFFGGSMAAVLLFDLSILKKRIDKYTQYMLLLLLFFLLIGLMPTMLYTIQPNINTVLKDIMLFMKFFICYAGARFFFYGANLKPALNYIWKITKLSLVIIFIFAMVSLVVNIGMGSSVRYGIRSYQFIFPHYTYLVYAVVLMLALLTLEPKSNGGYKGMAVIILLLTLRSKAFVFVGFYLLVMLFWKLFKEVKLNYVFLSTLIAAIAAKDKIMEYVNWGRYNLRTGLYIVGFELSNDYFPLGSGLGTYGTNISKWNFSPIYEKYNLIYSQGFAQGTGNFPISDVFWPYIVGQWGYLGLVIYIGMLILLYRSIRYQTLHLDKRYYLSAILLLIYLVIASGAEAIFTNETGLYISIILGIFFTETNTNEREYNL